MAYLFIEAYKDMITPVVDAFKYLTQLEYDVLEYVVIECLVHESRDKLKDDGLNLSFLSAAYSFCPGIMLLIFARASSHVPLKIMSIEDETAEYKSLPSFLFGQSMGGAVALKIHLKQPNAWDGAILVAPMCKIADDLVPPWLLTKILIGMAKFIPKAKLVPRDNLANMAFRHLEKWKLVTFSLRLLCFCPALFYDEERNEIYTSNRQGLVHVWSN